MSGKTVTEHLREHLMARADLPPERMPSLTELRRTEWSDEFAQLMRNRLVMGAFRYGRLATGAGVGLGRVASIAKRVERYIETGNDELLVDIANLAMVEFMLGVHPTKHFDALDEHDMHMEVID